MPIDVTQRSLKDLKIDGKWGGQLVIQIQAELVPNTFSVVGVAQGFYVCQRDKQGAEHLVVEERLGGSCFQIFFEMVAVNPDPFTGIARFEGGLALAIFRLFVFVVIRPVQLVNVAMQGMRWVQMDCNGLPYGRYLVCHIGQLFWRDVTFPVHRFNAP